MATLYDISWAFTVYHLLQLPLNAIGHKRQSSSHFTKEKGEEVLCRSSSRRKAFTCWNVPLWIGSLSLLATATLSVLRDGWFLRHALESWFPNLNQQCSNAAKVCSRVGSRCSWGTFPSLVGLSPVFPFRCSQCYIHWCVFAGLAQRDHSFQEKSQRKMLPSCPSRLGDGK